ncbi:MFS general substrate transporter [Agrocybe pediades]|nr:MFS general substrate transporter [Agrocybe pediades]
MAAEDTPLLVNDAQKQHELVYDRFSSRMKHAIVAMVSICGLMPLLVTGTFTPSIPRIAKDLNTTGPMVNLAVSLSAFAASLGGLIGGSYSTFYGRRYTYTYSLPVMVIGSIGSATAPTIYWLLFWRFLQSLGASPGMVLGAGVIGDIYKLEERGRGMAMFLAAILLGPTLAPLVGGLGAAHWSSGWRTVQAVLGLAGAIIFFIVYFFFPETSHPGTRGIDKLRVDHSSNAPVGFVFINPLRPMLLLRSPNLLLISVILSTSLMSVFVLLVPLAYTIGARYNISNEALVGACFTPAGLGNITGAAIVGRISDRTVISWRKRRGGVWYPEDRLRAALLPYALIIPITLVIFGLANQFIDGKLGLSICLICLYVNGIGIEMAFGPCAAYLVDVLHSRSAEALAANGGLRLVLMAAGISAVLPTINKLGVAATNAIVAGLAWLGLGLLWSVINYGDKMRAWVDVGYSNVDNN